jgi:hypothetical protein
VAEGLFSQKVQNLKDFTVSLSSKISIFLLVKKYDFSLKIYDTNSVDLEQIQTLQSSYFVDMFFLLTFLK